MTSRPMNDNGGTPLIPQFFAGRTVLVTGATGFMGKVLLERLLSTCEHVERVLVLLRSKKDSNSLNRLHQLKQSPVFDVIRERCPEQLDKLFAVTGDAALPCLGLDQNSLRELQEVSVVYHFAAALRFDEALDRAVRLNIQAVLDLMDLCDRLPNMQAFIHVSTAYCNAERSVVEERIYPSRVTPESVLSLVENVPQSILTEITQQYIQPKPNIYTFTKALAEIAIEQRPRKYPVAIFRPAIVVSSLRHPVPGWIENLNGPSGIIVGTGFGTLHVLRGCKNKHADLIPVDIAIDTLLAVAWETAIDNLPEVRVYNCSSTCNKLLWSQFGSYLVYNVRRYPFDGAIWYPAGFIIENKYLHKMAAFLFQDVPLNLAQRVLNICGIKPSINLITASKRMKAVDEALSYFVIREWHFSMDNVKRLQERLSPEDSQLYNLDAKTINWSAHTKDFVAGTRKYILRQKDQSLTQAQSHMKRLFLLHCTTLLVSLFFLYRLLRLIAPAVVRRILSISSLHQE